MAVGSACALSFSRCYGADGGEMSPSSLNATRLWSIPCHNSAHAHCEPDEELSVPLWCSKLQADVAQSTGTSRNAEYAGGGSSPPKHAARTSSRHGAMQLKRAKATCGRVISPTRPCRAPQHGTVRRSPASASRPVNISGRGGPARINALHSKLGKRRSPPLSHSSPPASAH